MEYKVYWTRSEILKRLKKGDVRYTDLLQKDITSACAVYKIKNIRTERVLIIHYTWVEKIVEELTAVYKD